MTAREFPAGEWADVIECIDLLLAEDMIRADVYSAACNAARRLSLTGVNIPTVFTHGPDSVVLNWDAGNKAAFYLTISRDKISALIS
jgi:hypothetical protein